MPGSLLGGTRSSFRGAPPWREPGIHLPESSACDARIKIDPLRILFLDQTNLPTAPPLFQLFFARNRSDWVVVHLDTDLLVDHLSRRETGSGRSCIFINLSA